MVSICQAEWVFDLIGIDGDDTLWHSEVHFAEAGRADRVVAPVVGDAAGAHGAGNSTTRRTPLRLMSVKMRTA